MRLRVLLIGALGGVLPVRPATIDQRVTRGEPATTKVSLGLFRGEAEVVVEPAETATTATAVKERAADPEGYTVAIALDTGDAVRLGKAAAHELHADLSRILNIAPPAEPAHLLVPTVIADYPVDEAAYSRIVRTAGAHEPTFFVGFGKSPGARVSHRAARELHDDLTHQLGSVGSAGIVPEAGNAG